MGYDAVTFNAPGAGQLLQNSSAIAAAAGVGKLVQALVNEGDPNYLNQHDNYHALGDGVGIIPPAVGSLFTIEAADPPPNNLANAFTSNHQISTTIAELAQKGTEIRSGLQDPDNQLNIFAHYVVPIAKPSGIASGLLTFNCYADSVANLFDPSSGSTFQFTENGASDPIQTVTFLPDDPDVAYVEVSALINGSYTAPVTVSAGVSDDFSSDTTGFEFEAFSSDGEAVSLPDGYLFDATFASSTQVSASRISRPANRGCPCRSVG